MTGTVDFKRWHISIDELIRDDCCGDGSCIEYHISRINRRVILAVNGNNLPYNRRV